MCESQRNTWQQMYKSSAERVEVPVSQTEQVGRRKFLKKTATAAAVVGFPTIIPGSALGMNDAVAPSERIHIASIGVGNMGGGHLRNLLQYDEVRVVGICDVKEERRQWAKSTVD